jgi:hypothetical protein
MALGGFLVGPENCLTLRTIARPSGVALVSMVPGCASLSIDATKA